MNIKCPNCGGELEYDPVIDKMSCTSCGASFDSMEAAGFRDRESSHSQTEEKEKMECRVYTCTECGAQLLINDVETATFCAYCGQPAIVSDRVSEKMKPDYIIPFVIRRERVPQILQERFGKKVAFFRDVDQYKIEDVKGVYIPYWSFDVHYHADQVWRGVKGSGEEATDYVFEREAEADFKDLIMDASKFFNDSFSQKLEPYDLRTKKPFEAAYLQGFYADCYDEDIEIVKHRLKIRAGEIYNDEIKKTMGDAGRLEIIEGHPECEITGASYILLPVWFVPIHFEGKVRTILINGQTGKVVGFLPFNKKKVALFTAGVSLISMFVTVPLAYAVFNGFRNGISNNFFLTSVVFFSPVLTIFGIFFIRKSFEILRESERLSGEEGIYHSVRDRQEKD